jgi:hypothetical protein
MEREQQIEQKNNQQLTINNFKMFKKWNLNDWMNNGLFFLTALILIYSFVF